MDATASFGGVRQRMGDDANPDRQVFNTQLTGLDLVTAGLSGGGATPRPLDRNPFSYIVTPDTDHLFRLQDDAATLEQVDLFRHCSSKRLRDNLL